MECTINKGQGQTLRVAGIELTTQCSSYGQLYVALSRVTSNKICYQEVINVIYKEIF